MKLLVLIYATSTLMFSANHCSKKAGQTQYRGRLEIAGICMNYTIKLLKGNLDTSRIASTWTDEVTGKVYNNVFALGNPCSFPASVKVGDEFYFLIDTATHNGCVTCMAYYPKPGKKLSIIVVQE